MTAVTDRQHIICIGGGPAGLTAAYKLAKAGHAVTVLESDPVYLGGISRTVAWKGFRFDIGGHRFFSKSPQAEAFWTEILGDEMLDRSRKSRILYRGKLFDYPLRAFDALAKLGLVEASLCMLSYGISRISPIRDARTFEDWVSNQFGRRLFRIFFKTYTEKVWGMRCSDISADWAAQRINGLSLARAILSALRPQRGTAGSQTIKTLIDRFRYPKLGPGMMWERTGQRIRDMGGCISNGVRVVGLTWRDNHSFIVHSVRADGSQEDLLADHVVCSAPMRDLAKMLSPDPSSPLAAAAARLRYRDFFTVALVVQDIGIFDDNWIYIHDPAVAVGRIQNFKSWSTDMIADSGVTCLGLEYFCFEGDEMWSRSDEDLVALATRELVKLGLATADAILDGCVVRQPKAYPVYDDGYVDAVDEIRLALRSYPNLHPVGRNGMHKYNNQDHAMITAMLVAENIIAGRPLHDPWSVNVDAEYHEEGLRPETLAPIGHLRVAPA